MKLFIMLVVGFAIGATLGVILTYKKMYAIVDSKSQLYNKFLMMYRMLERWLTYLQKGCSLEQYLCDRGYEKIAIYGLGEVGLLLMEELKDTKIKIICGIDKNSKINLPIDIKKPNDTIVDADAIIVTAIAYFYDIEKELSKYNKCPIISLEDIVCEIAY